jgi:hypothetical protein
MGSAAMAAMSRSRWGRHNTTCGCIWSDNLLGGAGILAQSIGGLAVRWQRLTGSGVLSLAIGEFSAAALEAA